MRFWTTFAAAFSTWLMNLAQQNEAYPMEIKSTYSHKGGEEFIKQNHPAALQDVVEAIAACDAVWCLRKITKEGTKNPLLFAPIAFNLCMKQFLSPRGWTEKQPGSKKGFKEPRISFGQGQFREMDGIKDKVGLEIQFGKYAFMGYDVFSKMPMFAKRGLIECGIEVVAMPEVVKEMSTGVSSFNQIVLDMKYRGVADLDLPTLIIGIGLTAAEKEGCDQKRARFLTHREQMIEAGEVSKGNKGSSPGPKGAELDYDEEALAEEEEAEQEESEQL
jgi:hypothetical protein